MSHLLSLIVRVILAKTFSSLAYLEMRLILARLLWNFDFELVNKNFEWTQQKAFVVWDKQPLMVHVKQHT